MKIKIGKTYSDKKKLIFSVLQGSCAGANLFNMYSSTISKELDPSFNLIGFADDHSIMKEFNPNLPVEENDTIVLLINNLAKIKTWMNSVRLKMNNSKSELIIFGNSIQRSKYITREINMEGETVHRSQLVRYLGVWLDRDLTFRTDVKRKCATAMLNLQRIKNIQKYLNTESCIRLVVNLYLSHLDYSNSILSALPDCTINQMQRIQNYGTKLILGGTKYDSNTQSLAELHWLPISSRIKFKILTLVFKCLRAEAPDYLRNVLIRCPETSQTLRSSSIKDHLVIPRTLRIKHLHQGHLV